MPQFTVRTTQHSGGITVTADRVIRRDGWVDFIRADVNVHSFRADAVTEIRRWNDPEPEAKPADAGTITATLKLDTAVFDKQVAAAKAAIAGLNGGVL